MLINLHNLIHLPVLTESGTKLGKIYDINIDIDNHSVKSYLIRSSIISHSHLVKPIQIVSITKDEIIVEDTVVAEKEKKQEKEKPKAVPSVAMRTEK